MSAHVENRYFTDAELEHLRTQGFIGPITVYEPDEMDRRWKQIRAELLDRTHACYPEDVASGLTNIANYDRHLDVDLLSEHIVHPEIAQRATELIGPDIICWRTEFFPKYKGDPGTGWHQADDFSNTSGVPQLAWPDDDRSGYPQSTLTIWTAFTDATVTNGCLKVIPGSHLTKYYDESKEMRYHADLISDDGKVSGAKNDFFGYDYRDLQIDPDWSPPEEEAVPLEMERGQCVIFWEALLHSSLPHTGKARDYRMGFATRLVPSFVRVYPGDPDVLEQFGGRVPLDKFGNVLVAGRNLNPDNKMTTHSLRGFEFKPY